MTRKEFEDWIDANNFRTVYDTSYESYRYCSGNQDPFEIGTYGCYESGSKWVVKSYKGALGDRPSTNYSLSYKDSIGTEEEALEILKTKILEHEHESICSNYEKNINAFIEEIKGKKIQNYFTYKNNNCDITRKDLDVLIGKYFKDCSYGFPKGTEQSLYIIHNNTHRPVLCIKGYNPPFPKIDYTNYLPIIYEYMNKKIMFLGNTIYELSSAHYDFQVDSTGIYLLEFNSIKKFDFNGKILWEKEMKFNSPNARFATNRELLIKKYNLEEYIGIIDLENLHMVSKGNYLLVKYKDIVCKIEENDDTIYLIPKMIYEQFKKIFGDDANIHVSPEDERINNQEEESVKLLKQKVLDYGFKEIEGEYKLQVYTGKNFNRVKVDEKNYGVSYGFFKLKKDNEIIYARELWTGMSDIPVYVQLTKKEYDDYIDKLNGKENIEVPKIDESERCFCDSYRNSGRNHFSYNDVFHEFPEDEKKKLNTEELKEFSQEITGYPTFKFYFPESMGEYCKQNDNVFELRKDNIQKIRVMISKCSSEENLEADAKKWIEFNKKETNMEDLSYRKEKINNIPIEVYELKKIGKKGTRIYKIGYVNGCRITISGGKVEGKEEIINTAFEKITWVDDIKSNNEKKVNETNPTTTSIIIDCPVCNSNFELKWDVPATEKTFYCKCPSCGMELKRGNPNYIDKNSNETNNKSMEEFIKLYAIALEKKVEKICEFLKGDNFNQILDKMKIIKSDLADSNNVDSLLSMLSAKALPDIPFEPGEDWRKALDFSDLPIYPHYCRLNLIKYQDESIENSLISSLNILLNNARAINNEELVSKIEEIILNINDVNSLRKFKKMEDCLKRIEFENFENGTIEYRSFLRDIFIKVDALIQKIKDNNNPPYQDLDIMSNINKIIKAEDNEEI